ncbi:MAG TPA: BTAD domain-containing putative transcriptional regulator [Streptosporangiaceae bacterium]|nr:BTAD domain-containing putative transcriptional regulator [Streptosporangiaceae bacterium]
MRFALLGPLEVSIEGKRLELGSNRQRVVLAMLLLHAGRVVPVSRLVDALWDGEPPATATGQVQTCVSALRRQLRDLGADGLVSTSSLGYAIAVPDGSLDITNFERLAEAGRAAAAEQRAEDAARELRAALALWRGPAAADIQSGLVQAAAIRLNEDHLGVLEECIQLELQLGREHALVGELSELVKEYPLREVLRAQHMLALYRSARQVEALESFQEARQTLIRELGLEPGERLCALQRAILAKDNSLDLHRETESHLNPVEVGSQAVPHQLPAAIADFTGRERMFNQLVELLSPPDRPDGLRYLPVASLNGKGGVGKTALALHVAHAVRHLYPDGQLFVQLRGADGQPTSPMDLMASVLRSLSLPTFALPEELAERTAVYRSRLGGRRILIVLDDASSVSQIMALIPGCPSCALIVTSRNPLSSLPGARHFEVDDLDEATSVELLSRVIGPERMQAEPMAALELVRLCGCLPLAVRIVAAKLATKRHWSITRMIRRMTDEAGRLDELALSGIGIRATVATSYGGLSQAARRLFLRLGLLGTTDFAPWVSAPLLDMEAEAANDLLEELVEARLVEVRLSEDGSSRFHLHDLVRIYALEHLAADESPAERAAALRRLLSCWLALATEAHRRAYGGDYAVLHGSADRWTLPDHVHDQLLGNPMTWFRTERPGLVQAVTQAAQIGLDELCWDLAVTAVTQFESEYRAEDWQKTHELALEATRRAGNVRGEAAVLCSLGNLALNGRLGEAPSYLTPALLTFEQIRDTHGRTLALAGLAFADRLGGRCERALARYREALSGYQEVGDMVGEVDALTNMAQIQIDQDQYDDAWQLLDRAAARGRLLNAPRITAQTEHRLGEFYLRTGDLWRAERSFRSVLEIVRNEGDVVGEGYVLADLGRVRTLRGQYELAEADLSAALAMSRRMTSNLVHGRVLLAFAELYLARGEPERAYALVGEALVIFSESGPAPVLRARILELRGRIDEQTGNPTAAAAARTMALALAGDADPAMCRALAAAIPAPAPGAALQAGARQPHGGPGDWGPADMEGGADAAAVSSPPPGADQPPTE